MLLVDVTVWTRWWPRMDSSTIQWTSITSTQKAACTERLHEKHQRIAPFLITVDDIVPYSQEVSHGKSHKCGRQLQERTRRRSEDVSLFSFLLLFPWEPSASRGLFCFPLKMARLRFKYPKKYSHLLSSLVTSNKDAVFTSMGTQCVWLLHSGGRSVLAWIERKTKEKNY